MKLRLRKGSIRLRLSMSEVVRFAETGAVEEKIQFGVSADERLTYRLAATAVGPIRAAFDANKITVYLPLIEAREWTATDQVGMQGEQAASGGGTLQILVKKDFTCLEPRFGVDDVDTFPHPMQCSQ